jgi:hypothetical protein
MKRIYLLLSFLFISTLTIAQGIAIQGIARDNASSAITDTNLTFTFSITKDDNTVQYAETQSIKTDNFGVFSHIVSTGTSTISAFNNVDFSITNLKMKVLVDYEGNTIEVYNQTFQYTPYAHFAKRAKNADDGVPTGAIMPYLGTTAPEGWVFCKGQSIVSVNGSAALRTLLDSNDAPNLQGMFLRGAGESKYGLRATGPSLQSYQDNSNLKHRHASGTLKTDYQGLHNHNNGVWAYLSKRSAGYDSPDGINDGNGSTEPSILDVQPMMTAGNHNHDVAGYTTDEGDTESRPVNYGVNYIIKL